MLTVSLNFMNADIDFCLQRIAISSARHSEVAVAGDDAHDELNGC